MSSVPELCHEAENHIGAIAWTVGEAVVSGTAIQEIRSGPAIEIVRTRTSEEPIIAGAARQRVAEVR